MSQENVELARQYFEAVNAHGLEGTQHLRHPDIEFIDTPNLLDAGRCVGEAAFRELVMDYQEMGWDGHLWVQEYVDAGNEVVVPWQMRGRTAHGGGFPFEVTVVHVCLFEGGKLRRLRAYSTREEALEAAGLSE